MKAGGAWGRPFALVTLAFSTLVVLTGANPAPVPPTLEIPEAEFERVEGYKPIPVPDASGGPVNQMFEFMDMDMTGTLPEAVLDSMLGQTPYDFVDVVWGMEVSGDWAQQITGTGTLQVTDFTEGRGATRQIDPERHTGAQGFRLYNARLQTEGDHVYTLSAALPPDPGGAALGTHLESVKTVFEVTWLCHMFEPSRTGCIDHPDEYRETELPELSNLRIHRTASGYRIEFAARVRESRSHREKGYRSTELTGRIGDVRGWVCDVASWEADPEDCIPKPPLEVVVNTPDHERENVNFNQPSVQWEFSVPVDIGTLRDSFSLITRDPGGNDIDVAGEVVRVGEQHFRFEPSQKLESGVQYEARIEGGKQGVLARGSRNPLPADHWWRFSTLLDLENQSDANDAPLEMHIYQTVRNAPLVQQKPSVIRIYPHWEAHDHIHPDWQPTSFPVTLDLNVVSDAQRRVEQQFGATAATEEIRLHRPDQFNDQHRRQAAHTVNVYGWQPDRNNSPQAAEARVAAYDPYPEPLQPATVIAEREFSIWQADPQPLVLRFAFLTVGPWADGVPSDDWLIAETVARTAADFAQQIFPVNEVVTAFTNVEVARPGKGVAPMKELLADLRNSPYIVSNPQDVLVIVLPFGALTYFDGEEHTPYSGGAVRTRFADESDRGILLSIATSIDGRQVPFTHQAESLVHEIGHYHGLAHKPGNADDIAAIGLTPGGYADPTIDGFRIALDGMSGSNKSYAEGNGEYPGTPTPLMWPAPLRLEQVWINDVEYRSLMNHMTR